MHPFLLRPRVVASLVLALSMPFAAGGGCGSRAACFAFSQAQFNQANGCPAQKDALADFTDAHCPGGIVSVDSDGSFDGELCCYQVTYDDIVPDCGAGGAGTGAFPNNGIVGVGPGGGFSAVSTSSGPPVCSTTCDQALVVGGPPPGPECGAAFNAFSNLNQCACTDSCVNECENSLCLSSAADSTCTACLQMSCFSQLATCQAE